MKFTLERFANKELHLTLHEPVKGKKCLIEGSLSPPEVNLFSFLILAHTLKKEGARKVIGFIPYLAYARHDKNERYKSLIASLVGRLLAAAGVDEVFVIDVHSPHVQELFPIPLISLSPAPLFQKKLGKQEGLSFAAPDKGAIERCQAVAGKRPIAWLDKTRHAKGVTHHFLHGTVSQKVVIIDDILDTGQTLISCCQKLQEAGVKEITVMVTHGLFTGRKWQRLWKLGVKKIYCTDTVPLRKNLCQDKRIIVISTKPLLKQLR